MNIKKIIFLLALLLSTFLSAQVAKDSELFLALKKHDSLFFEKSFNECDLAFLEKAIHLDLVFYHDQGGIQNKTTFLESVKNNICSNPSQKPIRKVKGDSLEVFPLYENGVLYGVVQNGMHEFYIREQGKKDVLTSTARFTHVYLWTNSQWILKEVLSYDHQ